MTLHRRLARGDAGSIALAMLGTMIILSFALILATTTVVQQTVTRREKLSSLALHAADAGMQDARYRLINRLIQTVDVQASGRTAPVTGSVNGVPFSWTASYDSSNFNWRVVSVGGAAVRRTVAATLKQGSRFDVALFTENGIGFRGGNSANSFDSTKTTATCTSPGVPVNCGWNTGNGVIASNGNINFSGNNTVDGVRLYDWAANPGAQRCPLQNAGTTYCVDPSSYRRNIDARFVLSQQLADINNQLADPACPLEGTAGVWKASDHVANGQATFNFPAGVHCFAQVIFDANTVLPAGIDAAHPLKIYVRDYVQMGKQGGGGLEVNCAGCKAATPPATLPSPASLLVFTPASSYGSGSGIAIYSQTKLAAGIYAPKGSCGSPGASDSQVDIYGSLLCSDITNQGGWAFHFDDNLSGRAGNGLFDITDWNESTQ